MVDCIFCKIVKGDIPSAKIWEDGGHIAIFDIFPNTKGQAVVIPKKHEPSYVFQMDDKAYIKFLEAGKKAGLLLDKALGSMRTAMVTEGMQVDHAHIKLFPLYAGGKMVEEKGKFFAAYEGYITTLGGPKADFAELQRLAEKIRNFK
ncbi:MAG: HIT family protein [DPANN group archaeon]|nr:HIT family protein [DPANN group archaeon]